MGWIRKTLTVLVLISPAGCQAPDPWVITETIQADSLGEQRKQTQLLEKVVEAFERLKPAPDQIGDEGEPEDVLTPEEFDEVEGLKNTPADEPAAEESQTEATEPAAKESQTEAPEPPAEKVSHVWGTSHFRVTMYSGDGCPPCRAWKAREEKTVRETGAKIQHRPGSQIPAHRANPGKRIPFFVIEHWTAGGKWVEDGAFLGYTDAGKINSLIGRKIDELSGKKKTPTVYAAAEPQKTDLRAWVRARYKMGQMLTADVMPRSSVWMHLVQHGFRDEDVRDLDMWDALCLHDAAHRGLIGKRHP